MSNDTFVNKPGLGTMRANKFKDSESKPDIKGEITLHGGEIVKFAGWKKQDRNGGTYYSLKQDRPREDAVDAFRGGGDAGVSGGQAGGSSRGAAPVDLDDPFSDSIPFARRDTVW